MALVLQIIQDFLSLLMSSGFFNICLLVICTGLSLVILLRLKSPPSPNPFSKQFLRPPVDLVTDKAERDTVLKQGFTSKKIPENLDAIVIGSGIGGLSTAALLSKAGKKVLVLEQHDQAGGCCHTFIEKGFEFDVGIHYVGELAGNTMSNVLVNQITDGQLRFAPLDDNFDVVSIGDLKNPRLYRYYSGKERMKESFFKQFPDDKEAIEKFFKLVRKAKNSVLVWFMLKVMPRWIALFLIRTGLINIITPFFTLSQKTLSEVLDELTNNEYLKATLAYSFGDYGTLPRDAPFTMHALLFQHFMYGNYYPVGGASEIAFHIIPVIERSGGKVLVRAPVSEILFNERGHAVGVRVRKGGNDFDVFAPLVISAAGVINTYTKLVPEPLRDNPTIKDLLSRVKPGYGGFNVFIGLNASKEELGLKAQNYWVFAKPELNQIYDEYYLQSPDKVGKDNIPLLFVSFPSTKDPDWEKRFPGKTTCSIVTLANWEWFEKWKDERVMKRGDDYEELKNRIAERAWEQVCTLLPQVRGKCEYFDVGSPLTNQYYIASSRGEIYGLDHNRARFTPETTIKLRPETPFPGLLLAGQDVSVCGFSGGLYGGVICASKVLNRNLLIDLKNFSFKIRKESSSEAKKAD